METLRFDLSKKAGTFKILNATNGGPWYRRSATSQNRSNLEAYKAARIPYARNHDSAMCGVYGGPYSHDISNIFPNPEADPLLPESYDFACTDDSILSCLEAGTETYFRLGQTIEHHIKKHNTFPKMDFKKWAVVCEHIIRHYNEGWADGYHLNIKYWEIWNEPDLGCNDPATSKTWGGTPAQFYDFFATAVKHLKECFPNIKVGGPALAHDEDWAEAFMTEMVKRNIPIDFFTWHRYTGRVGRIIENSEYIKDLLVRYGYTETESHLNEWNYLKGWKGDDFQATINAIHGMKGAAFTMAIICAAQDSTIDMLMYYDTRPSVFCGAFDYYSYQPLKGYYPLYWYGMFYDMVAEIKAENKLDDVYSLCGVDKDGKVLSVLCYYTNEEDTAENKSVKVDLGREGKYEVYLLDENHTNELVATTSDLTFELTPNSCILIKEI
ncbi:MAG: hypothetical protein IJA47_01975 [Oscillospiraceae bacterium]|nr:hypothetical protein [Oscillospiraceae bacterium]